MEKDFLRYDLVSQINTNNQKRLDAKNAILKQKRIIKFEKFERRVHIVIMLLAIILMGIVEGL